MNVHVRGENVEVTKAIENYIGDKLKRIERYLEKGNTAKANAIINVKDYKQKVEITIPMNNVIIRGEVTSEDLYASIDLVVDKLERQIRKNKTKLETKKMKTTISKDFVLNEIEAIKDEKENKIVKRKKIEIDPMDEEEALVQMELLGHSFYVFKDFETLKTMVVYKRDDGNYGLIEEK